MKSRDLSYLLVSALLVASACSDVRPDTLVIRFGTSKLASISGQTKNFSRLLVTVVREQPLPGFYLQRLPSSYNSADLVLSNANNLLSGFDNKTLNIATGTSQATGIYTSLRPGSGYKLGCTLKNNGATVGSGYSDGITLIAGVNTVTIIIGVSGDINISTSATSNTFGDASEWLIVKGDTLTFNTGFDANESSKTTAPANLKMQVILGSAIYDSDASQPSRIIAEKTSNFDQFLFESGISANAGATPGYDKNELTVSSNSTVTFRLLSGAQVVGESVASPVRVIDGSSFNLQLQ